MSTDYQPGTVAMASVPDYTAQFDEKPHPTRTERVSRYSDGWALLSDPDVFWPDHRGDVTDIRPLVVLDPKVDIQPAFSIDWLRSAADTVARAHEYESSCVKMLRSLADQIEAQTKPPRIPEPGLWGVVEASPATGSPAMRRWVRYGTGWRDAFGGSAAWSDLLNPTLVREGVAS